MNEETTSHPTLLERFQAVAEETRFGIVQRLARGERCVCELQDDLDAAQSRLSFHLKKLKDAGVVSDRREGRWVYYSLVPEALEEMRAFLGEVKPTDGGTMSGTLKDVVRTKYGEAATRAAAGARGTCCGTSCGCGPEASDPVTRDLYDEVTASSLPETAVLASLGCGNPTALAELREGEVVLDLGSGGGIDVLLSARRVGPTGKAYGLDMTDEMLELARGNAAEAGATNVEFLKGDIEAIPLPDSSVDVIISNCVINLSADKERVLREAYRVLRPGGRFAVSDVVVRGAVPPEVRRSLELWVGCVAGALEEREFEALLRAAGFEDPSLEPTRVYDLDDARSFLEEGGLDVDALASAVEGRLMSAFVRARKPEAPCCGPDCCP